MRSGLRENGVRFDLQRKPSRYPICQPLECIALMNNPCPFNSKSIESDPIDLLLVTPATEYSLPKTLQSIGRRYVQYFNFTYQRTGTLWEGRYKSTLIDSERYLLTCMRYIEMNPVRAEMVAHPGDYPWSSYRANGQGNAEGLIVPHELYQSLGRTDGERQSAYRQLFRAQLAKADVEAIRNATNKGWVLGDSRFGAKVAALTERRVMPLPRGRPKREVAD